MEKWTPEKILKDPQTDVLAKELTFWELKEAFNGNIILDLKDK